MREMKDSGVEWIGKIPKDWEIVPLTKQLDSIVDYRGKTPEKTEEGTFLVTAKNIKDGKICYELSKEYVREADYEEIMHRGIPQIGDILFTTEAPLGQAEDEAEHQDMLDKLTKAMECLLPQQKELFKKVYLEKRSNTDIATEEGVTEAAIRGRLKKLQERLRKILS